MASCGGAAPVADPTAATASTVIENVAPTRNVVISLDASLQELQELVDSGELEAVELEVAGSDYSRQVEHGRVLYDNNVLTIEACDAPNVTFLVDQQLTLYVLLDKEIRPRGGGSQLNEMYVPMCARWFYQLPEGYTFGGKFEPTS